MFVTISVVLMAIVAVLAAVSAVALVAKVCGGSFRKFFMKGLWALLLPPAVMLYGMIVERNIYNVRGWKSHLTSCLPVLTGIESSTFQIYT